MLKSIFLAPSPKLLLTLVMPQKLGEIINAGRVPWVIAALNEAKFSALRKKPANPDVPMFVLSACSRQLTSLAGPQIWLKGELYCTYRTAYAVQ